MATTSADRIFVDTNVITRATISAAPLHHEARESLDKLWEQGAELCISHQVIREYMANATRPQTYSPALKMEDVLRQVQRLQETFTVLYETPLVLEKLLALAKSTPMGGKQLHDANIVATMLANDISRLLTHNVADFARFAVHITVIPLAEEPSP